MYHEHPLRILRYSAKNIWLLIFPLLRVTRVYRLDVDKVYNWLKGAWFDIAVIGVIILFGLIRWYFSRITITEKAVIHTDGVFIKVCKAIPYENMSSVTVERSFYLRPFGGMRIYLDTSAGIFRASDMKLMINKKVCAEIMKQLSSVSEKEEKYYRHKPNLLSVLLFSVFFSSSFSGAIYVAAFFFKGGDIARDIISVSLDRIIHETSRIAGFVIQKIPAAAVGAGSFFLATWILSFALNIFRYSRFCLRSDRQRIEVICGAVTRRSYSINSSHINYTDLRQNLLMKIFRAVTVNISCAGYGSSKKHLPVLLPIKKQSRLSSGVEKIGICSGFKNEFRPKITSVWQYIWAPVIAAVLIYPASRIAQLLFPGISDLIFFVMIMAEIPAVWLIFIKVAAVFTSGILIYEDRIMIRWSRGFSFHTVIADRSRLAKLSVSQTPFQRMFKKCAVSFNFNGEQAQKHSVKAIRLKDAERIALLLGYELALDKNVKK